MVQSTLKGILLFLVGVLLMGCIPDEVCRENSEIVAGIGCEWIKIDNEGLEVLQLTWDSVTMKGVENDSIIYYNEKNIEQIYAPLRSDTTVTALHIQWHQVADTLWVKHKNEQNFISMACGCFIYHKIDSVWSGKHCIDSAYVVNTNVINVKEKNVVVKLKIED